MPYVRKTSLSFIELMSLTIDVPIFRHCVSTLEWPRRSSGITAHQWLGTRTSTSLWPFSAKFIMSLWRTMVLYSTHTRLDILWHAVSSWMQLYKSRDIQTWVVEATKWPFVSFCHHFLQVYDYFENTYRYLSTCRYLSTAMIHQPVYRSDLARSCSFCVASRSYCG